MNPGSGKTAIKISNDGLKNLYAERANRILDIVKANKAEIVILGAFGCGAFKNPQEVIAEGVMEAVKNHIYDFETIEFAICSPRNFTRNSLFDFIRFIYDVVASQKEG